MAVSGRVLREALALPGGLKCETVLKAESSIQHGNLAARGMLRDAMKSMRALASVGSSLERSK